MTNKPRNPLTWVTRRLGGKLGIGIITIVPFAATAWILYWLFTNIDGWLQPIIKQIWGNPIPGAGFAATLILVLLVGFIASNVIGKSLLRWVEAVIPGMPIVHQLYSGIKQIAESLSTPKGIGRMPPVIIEFPKKGMKALGFITSELCNEDGKKLYVVYIPTVPTPAGGFMQIVEESEIIRTNISIEDAIKMVVSAGTVVPDSIIRALFLEGKTSSEK